MEQTTTALTTTVMSGSPYQLSESQVLRASRALLRHVQEKSKTAAQESKDLLADENTLATAPIWLTLTTKRHITDSARLKPKLISVPHALHIPTTSTSICLITADPQRAYKDLIASDDFPRDLARRITRVIGMTKLREKYSQYEAQRQLFAEHDIFLADDRIITRLSGALGKTFYKTTVKRPVPVKLAAPPVKVDGKRAARAKGPAATRRKGNDAPHAPTIASADHVAKEISKAIGAALVHLSPSTHTAIKIGFASWQPEDIAANADAVVAGLVEKFVPGKWRGVRSLHLLGHGTAALPLWLADELWTSETDIIVAGAANAEKETNGVKANVGKKRKALVVPDDLEEETSEADATKENDNQKESTKQQQKTKKRKVAKPDAATQSNDALDKEIAHRKAILRAQKEEAADGQGYADVAASMPSASEPGKKGKGKGKSRSRKSEA